jgi:hypothetical protein
MYRVSFIHDNRNGIGFGIIIIFCSILYLFTCRIQQPMANYSHDEYKIAAIKQGQNKQRKITESVKVI